MGPHAAALCIEDCRFVNVARTNEAIYKSACSQLMSRNGISNLVSTYAIGLQFRISILNASKAEKKVRNKFYLATTLQVRVGSREWQYSEVAQRFCIRYSFFPFCWAWWIAQGGVVWLFQELVMRQAMEGGRGVLNFPPEHGSSALRYWLV